MRYPDKPSQSKKIPFVGYAGWVLLMFAWGVVSPAVSGEPESWRLVDFSAGAGIAVFSDSSARPAAFRTGDFVEGGRWRIESIATDHVILDPVREGDTFMSAAVVLRKGDEVPDPTRLVPEPAFYYEVHGVVVDAVEPGEGDGARAGAQ